MAWFICFLYALAFVFWLLSWRTHDLLVAWCRFGAACVFAFFGTLFGAVELFFWLMA